MKKVPIQCTRMYGIIILIITLVLQLVQVVVLARSDPRPLPPKLVLPRGCMLRPNSPLKRSQTEAPLTVGKIRANSPLPQPPHAAGRRSPRDGSKTRFCRAQDFGQGSNSEPTSPATSPRRYGGSGRGIGQPPNFAQSAVAVYQECRCILSSYECLKEARVGNGSSRHGSENSTRLEREHRELVIAFGKKCEQLRVSHASRSGVELRFSQLEAVGANELMKQRLEAAEAAVCRAHDEMDVECARHEMREAQLMNMLGCRDREIETLRAESLESYSAASNHTCVDAQHLLCETHGISDDHNMTLIADGVKWHHNVTLNADDVKCHANAHELTLVRSLEICSDSHDSSRSMSDSYTSEATGSSPLPAITHDAHELSSKVGSDSKQRAPQQNATMPGFSAC